MPSSQNGNNSHKASPSLEDCEIHCISHPPCLSCALSLSLSPPSLPESHSIHFSSTTSLSLQTLIQPATASPSLSLSSSSTLSLSVQRNAECGKLWLFGCWYSRLCFKVSDFHWRLEWDCTRTSVFSTCALYTVCVCVSPSSLSLITSAATFCGCAARRKKSICFYDEQAAVWNVAEYYIAELDAR